MTDTSKSRKGARQFLNGKWLAQTPSGTQRYATEVVRAAVRDGLVPDTTLVVPRDAPVPVWAEGLPLLRSRLTGTLFEQVALPWAARGGHLFSLAGPAALLKRDQTVVMHDAMPFRHPQTFRVAFVRWYRLMYGVLGRTAARLFTVSEFSRSELSEVLRVPTSRFGLAPCGADHIVVPAPDLDEPLPFPKGSYLLVVGNLAPHKNVAATVGALSHAGLPVAVIGGAQDQVFHTVDLAPVEHVVFLGRVSDPRLEQLYANAAALVMPKPS